MSDDRMQYPERSSELNTLLGWLKEFFGQFRLAWELLWDGRVPLITKIVPLLTMIYLLSPVDFIPDMALGLGQLDDLAIFLVGLRLFIDICPPELVAEHKRGADPATPDAVWEPSQGSVIDVEATDVSDDPDAVAQEEA